MDSSEAQQQPELDRQATLPEVDAGAVSRDESFDAISHHASATFTSEVRYCLLKLR